MNPYDSKPWLALYDADQPPRAVRAGPCDALAMFRAAVERAAARPAIRYFDATLSWRQLDALSDSLAWLLVQGGFAHGDRLAIFLQNVPQFPIAVLAAWKAGGIAVPINPMNRARELGLVLQDCRPYALVCHGSLHAQVVLQLAGEAREATPRLVYATSALDFQQRHDERLFASVRRMPAPGVPDLLEALGAAAGRKPPPPPDYAGSDIAFLVYTSGTTGVPKAAMNTHGNVTFNASTYRDWMRLEDGIGILAIAPLFHITGIVGHLLASFATAGTLVLSYRFEPGVMLDTVQEHRPGFTIGSITAFIAMLNHPPALREQLASLTRIYTGGAPVPPNVVEQFRARFGHYIRNGYGLTETASPTHAVPLGREAPVDAQSGALAIGVPVHETACWIAGDDGMPAEISEYGEIVCSGPMVAPGYWGKPAETAAAMRSDGFRTGDIGFMDAAGWFYVVDRKKDMINVAGYKVWPREVEDVLYAHPAVREAAVVGVPDSYRGETVKAVVSLKPGQTVAVEELAAWCKDRMAAYKYPRLVELMDDLPKTLTGKILRRALR